MTDSILCTPHFDEGRPVFGLRIEAMITITHPDGRVEELSGGGDLCEDKHAKPFLAAIEYLRAAGKPPVISGEVVRIEPKTSPEPPKAAAAPPQPAQKPGIFRCIEVRRGEATEVGCGEEVPYRSRPRHAVYEHDVKSWEVKWAPLFDISGWHTCSCGYVIQSESGVLQHAKTSGTGHALMSEPYHWDASDMKTTTSAALARAVGK